MQLWRRMMTCLLVCFRLTRNPVVRISSFLGRAGSKVMIKKVMMAIPLVQADVTYPPS